MNELAKAHFDVLFASLKGYQEGLFDGAFKSSGFLILVIGWLLTSKDARGYLADNAGARRLCAGALALGAVIYAAVSWRVYSLSQVAFNGLVSLNYLPVSAFREHRVQGSTLLLLIAQNALLTLVACHFMLGGGALRRVRGKRAALQS